MASVGHAALGLVGARLYEGQRPGWRELPYWVAISFLPDADVGMFLVVPYAHPLGHRGAAHSLLVAVVLGALFGAVARLLRVANPLRLAVVSTLIIASHGLLDTMTHGGGQGVGLLWPFDTTRYWSPWRPIPVAPIGADYLSARGLYVFLVESLQFLPIAVLAMLPWRRRATPSEPR